MLFPDYRPRRLRKNEAFRALIRETHLSPAQLIYPIFVMPGKNNKGAAKRAIMHRILRRNVVYVTTHMHQKTLVGLTNPSGFFVLAVILIRVTAGISLHLIFGGLGIAGIQPTGFQTLQERGMNLPVQAAMIRTHLTPPCSSQNMAPGALVYV